MKGYCIKCQARMKMKDVGKKIEGNKKIISGYCVKCGTKIFDITDLKSEALYKDSIKTSRLIMFLVFIVLGFLVYLLLNDSRSFLFFLSGMIVSFYFFYLSEKEKIKTSKIFDYEKEKRNIKELK